MFSKKDTLLKNNYIKQDKRIQQLTKRLSVGSQKRQSLAQEDGFITERAYHSLWQINNILETNLKLKDIMKQCELLQIYTSFVQFQNKFKRSSQSPQKLHQENQFSEKILTEWKQQCLSFKHKIKNLIFKNHQSLITSKSQSSEKQKNQQITNLLEQVYSLRQKLRQYEMQNHNSFLFSKSFTQQNQKKIKNNFNLNKKNSNFSDFQSKVSNNQNQNLNPNIMNYNQQQKCLNNQKIQYENKVLQCIMKQQNQKQSKKISQIYKYYLQIKAGFLNLCGSFWKIISIILPSASEELFSHLNALRNKELNSKTYLENKIKLQHITKMMNKSNNDLLTLASFINFLIKSKVQLKKKVIKCQNLNVSKNIKQIDTFIL